MDPRTSVVRACELGIGGGSTSSGGDVNESVGIDDGDDDQALCSL
jgi:hypothetical protein